MKMRDRAIGSLLGLAGGDAVGTTVEFRPRGSFTPLTDMIGGGPFGLRAGEWTDDTSMALALAESLAGRDDLDEHDLMRRFLAWWRDGEYSHNGRCFDIGATTSAALARFERTGNPVAGDDRPGAAGNGSLMRLAPVAIWGLRTSEARLRDVARRQSATTHATDACLDACEAYALLLSRVISGGALVATLRQVAKEVPAMKRYLLGDPKRPPGAVDATGYVLHTLDAAVWAVRSTGDFRGAILAAANLGDDADTTAAVAGQLAGALYGASGVPAEWLEKLVWRDRIERTAFALLD